MTDLSSNIDKILTENLPKSLEQLSKRNESYQKIASHLETEYISARRSGVEDQTNVVLQDSKKYLTQSLVHLVNDLGVISEQFNQLLYLQDHALDSIANQADLLQSRITTSKNQKLYSTLEEMQSPYRVETNIPSVREIPLNEINTPIHLRGVRLTKKE